MARRKTAEVEDLPPEDEPKRTRRKVVEAKHTVTYAAPEIVDVPVDAEEDLPFDDDLIEEVEERERPKRRQRNEREELRKRLSTGGVTPTSQLKLSIERYVHSESLDSGTLAEKAFCTKYACNEAHVTGEDYLDVARTYGAGRYWFTLRLNNKIVTQWERRIDAAPNMAGQIVQNAIPGDPTSPQVIVMPSQAPAQPVGQIDPMKQLKELLQMQKLMRDALGPEQVPPPKENAAESFMNHPKVIDTMVDTIVTVAKKAAGLKGENSGGDNGWTDVAMEVVKSGQVKDLAEVAAVAIQTLLGGILGGQNGQAAMGAPMHTAVGQNQNSGSQSAFNDSPIQIQAGPQASPQNLPSVQTNQQPTNEHAINPAQTPEDQALALVIDHCRRRLPARLAYDRLMAFADAINEQAPQYSIDFYISTFAQMEVEDALAFVKEQPGGAEVEAMAHSREWTKELQALIQNAEEE